MKRLLYLIFLLAQPAVAFHIVGGEIEFITLRNGTYRINVVQYFDKAQIENPGPEAEATVYIYRNSDNKLMSTHTLPFFIETDVRYTNNDCAIDQLKNSRVIWGADIQLNPQEYDDPAGYYIVWERCCRNANIINIINPSSSGMTYVTEIPPLWANGAPFINSSPELFRPLSDYACQFQLYYIDFTGTDRDGDSLVYSLTQPLNSSASVALPIPQPKPHFTVRFDEEKGYFDNDMIPGSPGLAISRKGLLTVNPSKSGLHVFSVLVEEYRNGVKIGQVRRDFQMLVLPTEQCNPPDPPQVGIQIPGKPNFETALDTLSYAYNEEKCFDYIVSNITPGETITLRAEGVNFDGDIDEIFQINQLLVGENQDSLLVEICAPDCPPLGGETFVVDLIAGDDACPLPQMDTLRLIMQVEPLPNQYPSLSLTDDVISINQGSIFERAFEIEDPDGDSIYLEYFIPEQDSIEQFGFDVEILESSPGYARGIFRWDANCQIYQFGEQQQFDLYFRSEDDDFCQYQNPDLSYLNMNVILPGNNLPVVTIVGAPMEGFNAPVDQSIQFTVTATDVDGDQVSLEMAGVGFNPAAYGAVMESTSGISTTSSTFSWLADCDFYNPQESNSFKFAFIAQDQDFCNTSQIDTLFYVIQITQPPNNAPDVISPGAFTLEVNEQFEIPIYANDLDEDDEITLSLQQGLRLPQTETLIFESVTGQSSVSSIFRWTPECSLLRNGDPTTYRIFFQVRDSYCPISATDTAALVLTIQETRDQFDGFLPPNVFTPNDDGINDVFHLSGFEDPALNLPVDNCEDYFEYISIHNRQGATVFYSDDRLFEWDGGDLPTGTYFYIIKYSVTEYKNYIQLLR